MNRLNISFDGLKTAYPEYREQALEIIDEVLSRGIRLRSRNIDLFEDKCRKHFQRKFTVAVNSGTDALVIALRALNVGFGDEVIVTSFSFLASASCILLVGAKPVFVDIDPDTLLMDLNQVKDAITAKTKAIIVVQLFGQCNNFSLIEDIVKPHGIKIIEDAAQAFGSSHLGRPAGNFGEISILSFDPSKVISGLTTGGIICTDDFDLYEKSKLLRCHGYEKNTKDFAVLGYNSQMSEINAAFLVHQLNLNKELLKRRSEVTVIYEMGLARLPALKTLIKTSMSGNNFHKYPILVENRHRLIEYLKLQGIPTKIHYSRPLAHYKIFKERCRCISSLKIATEISDKILSLPIHSFLSFTEINQILSRIKKYYLTI